MVDDVRRARLLKEFEQIFLPDYDASSMPPADKRAAYALEHIAFRLGRIEQKFDEIINLISANLAGPPRP